jgi:hypothetical protein
MVDVVRIGVGSAVIRSVTRETVEYVDNAGRAMSVDMFECARNWTQSRNSDKSPPFEGPGWIKVTPEWGGPTHAARLPQVYIGLRDLTGEQPWCQFFNERRTKFEFKEQELMYSMLLTPLMRSGWHTLDLS